MHLRPSDSTFLSKFLPWSLSHHSFCFPGGTTNVCLCTAPRWVHCTRYPWAHISVQQWDSVPVLPTPRSVLHMGFPGVQVPPSPLPLPNTGIEVLLSSLSEPCWSENSAEPGIVPLAARDPFPSQAHLFIFLCSIFLDVAQRHRAAQAAPPPSCIPSCSGTQP